jgi:hypothetical protein
MYLVSDPALNDRNWTAFSAVVGVTRQPFWTQFFVGDWELNTGMAMFERTEGRDVYRIVNGGMSLPPLRINADGTYAWRISQGGRETLLRGQWAARQDAPGIVLLKGDRGTDWAVWFNSTQSTVRTFGRDQIRLNSPTYSWVGLRIAPNGNGNRR